MNQNSVIAISTLALTVVAGAAHAELLDGGWRLSAGAVYDSGVKTDVRFSPQQTYATPYSIAEDAISQREAAARARGATDGSRTTWVTPSGEEAWIDFGDPADGWDSGSTEYYHFPESSLDDDNRFMLANPKYEELYVHQTPFAEQEQRDRDERAMPGVNLQLSRNLYHDEENGWGLEVAVAVQYARRNKAVNSRSSWLIGNSVKRSGEYATTYTDYGELREALGSEYCSGRIWDEDADNKKFVGQTDYASENPAIPIDLEGLDIEWGADETLTDADFGSLYAHGDYDNLEFMLLLQPYYDVNDWFSVNATLGVVCSRQTMDMRMSLYRNGVKEYSSDRDYDQWDVYGIAGLGMMFYYDGWTLSGDAMARFLDDDMEIRDKYYKGKVTRGDWLVRVGLGYEF